MALSREEVLGRIDKFYGACRQQPANLADPAAIEAFFKDIGGVRALFGIVLEAGESAPISVRTLMSGLFRSKAAFPFLSTNEALTLLTAGISYPVEGVREYVLAHVAYWAEGDEGVQKLLQPPLFPSLLGAVSDASVEVGGQAQALLVALARREEGLAALFHPSATQTILPPKDQQGRVSPASLRVHSLFTTIATLGTAAFERYKNSPHWPRLLGLLTSEEAAGDPLTTLNVMEITKKLLKTKDAFDLLMDHAIVCLVVGLCPPPGEGQSEPDFLEEMVVCGALDFIRDVGEASHPFEWHGWAASLVQPGEHGSESKGWPDLASFLAHHVDSANGKVQLAAANAISAICCGVAGLRYLGTPLLSQRNQNGGRAGPLYSIAHVATQSDEDARAQGMMGVAAVLGNEHDAPDAADTREIQHELFSALREASGRGVLDFLVSNAKLPFPRVQRAALAVLAAVASQQFGLDAICGDDKCLDFLLDAEGQAMVADKEARRLRFAVVQQMQRNPFFKAGGRITDGVVLRVASFVTGGWEQHVQRNSVPMEMKTIA